MLTLSSAKSAKAYTISYNANGGSVSPASKSHEDLHAMVGNADGDEWIP